jgi:hypothetical protein
MCQQAAPPAATCGVPVRSNLRPKFAFAAVGKTEARSTT